MVPGPALRRTGARLALGPASVCMSTAPPSEPAERKARSSERTLAERREPETQVHCVRWNGVCLTGGSGGPLAWIRVPCGEIASCGGVRPSGCSTRKLTTGPPRGGCACRVSWASIIRSNQGVVCNSPERITIRTHQEYCYRQMTACWMRSMCSFTLRQH